MTHDLVCDALRLYENNFSTFPSDKILQKPGLFRKKNQDIELKFLNKSCKIANTVKPHKMIKEKALKWYMIVCYLDTIL